MNKITINYCGESISAYPLARFFMTDEEVPSVRGLFGSTKTTVKTVRRERYLVFIPWRHREKELAIIPRGDVDVEIKNTCGNIISVESFVSPFKAEEPYYAEYEITDFSGYRFIYDYRSFIADVRNRCSEEPLEILYANLPMLSEGETDDA